MSKLVKKTTDLTFPAAALIASFKRDFKSLNDDEKLRYVHGVCKALKIPAVLNPFYFIPGGGKLHLYASSEAAQLIANKNGITCEIISRITETATGLHTVCVRATMKNGRCHDNIGVVSISGLTGEALANAMMKAVTKAMRRTILSAVGLSIDATAEAGEMPTASQKDVTTPPVQLVVPEPEVNNEAIELKNGLFDLLVGNKGLFPGKPKMATEWIIKEGGKEFAELDATDTDELIGKASILIEERNEVDGTKQKG